MSITWLARLITPIPAPRPRSAVAIGRPIALNDPKLISRIRIAAAIPTTVANPSEACCACSIAWPPSWTSSVAERADSAVDDHVVDGCLGERVGALVEVHRGERDRPVTRRSRAGPAAYGLTTLVTWGRPSDALQRRVDRRAIGRVGELAGLGVEHDLVGVAGLGGEVALEQVDGLLRVRARQREAARRLLPDRARDREDPDRGDDPGDHDGPSVQPSSSERF